MRNIGLFLASRDYMNHLMAVCFKGGRKIHYIYNGSSQAEKICLVPGSWKITIHLLLSYLIVRGGIISIVNYKKNKMYHLRCSSLIVRVYNLC